MLVLPDSSFKPTQNIRECLGAPAHEIITLKANRITAPWIDSTCSLYYIRELTPNPDLVFRQRTRFNYHNTHAATPTWDSEGNLSDIWDSSDSESEVDMDTEMAKGKKGYPMVTGQRNDQWPGLTPYSGVPSSKLDDPFEGTQLSRYIIPSFGQVQFMDGNTAQQLAFNAQNLHRKSNTDSIDFLEAELPAHVVKNFHIFRSSATDLQLQSFNPATPSVECKFVLTQHNTDHTNAWDMGPAFTERVSMLIHVPELNLVVAGSPTGRVALITLTKTNKRIQNTPVRRGFRVDRVLPRKSEDQWKLRPACPMVGIAMSPVPDHRARGLELHPPGGRTSPAMYRLMMHYKDHTILMYDIARGLDEDDLMIF